MFKNWYKYGLNLDIPSFSLLNTNDINVSSKSKNKVNGFIGDDFNLKFIRGELLFKFEYNIDPLELFNFNILVRKILYILSWGNFE